MEKFIDKEQIVEKYNGNLKLPYYWPPINTINFHNKNKDKNKRTKEKNEANCLEIEEIFKDKFNFYDMKWSFPVIFYFKKIIRK